jgi:mono/diheme cytochrome c family protein
MGVMLIGLGFSAPRTEETPKNLKTVPVRAARSLAGPDLFREYCAVCHGSDAKGDGPAAAALKTQPSNLTQIARNSGGRFPEIRVQNIINGDSDPSAAHGSREMPVWGSIFRHMGPNEDMANVRVYNLMKYIEDLQEK